MKVNKGISSIISLLFFGSFSLANGLPQSQQELSEILREIILTGQNITSVDTELDQVDTKIEQTEKSNNQSWLNRRRIVKLTETKAALISDRLIYDEHLLELQNQANNLSSTILSQASYKIDSLIIQINSTDSAEKRKSGLEELMKAIELRNWIINTKSHYTSLENEQIPEKMDLQKIMTMALTNPGIKTDLINLLNGKISELDLMIKTAEDEEILQDRLEQFSFEMASISAEITEQAVYLKKDIKTTAETDGTYGGNSWEVDRNFQVASTDNNLPSLTGYDYLPMINSLDPTELSNYIFSLDSIRNYYINERQKILNQ